MAIDASKWCPDCRRDRPITEFTRNARMRDGLAFYCTPCRRTREEASRRHRNGPAKSRVKPREVEVPSGSKWCPHCGQVKLLEEFPRNRSARSGVGAHCKPCHNRVVRENKDAHGGARNYHLRRRYGITAEHADRMLAEQGGRCAICREAPAEHVDHDHASGRVRGMLCFNCNGALGQFRDRTDLMIRAVGYLQGEPWRSLLAHPDCTVGFDIGPADLAEAARAPE